MVKAVLFMFIEYNIQWAIDEYKQITGKECKVLECNHITMKLWELYSELKYPMSYEPLTEKQALGRIAMYQGINIVENNNLEDGIIMLK